jgi:hypothetical protein
MIMGVRSPTKQIGRRHLRLIQVHETKMFAITLGVHNDSKYISIFDVGSRYHYLHWKSRHGVIVSGSKLFSKLTRSTFL